MFKVRKATAAGFTLVEMLVVIAIIGVLVSLLIPTIGTALRNAKNARIVLDINQLASALETYKQTYGDYPPDFSSRNVVIQHLAKAFPNISAQEATTVTNIFWVNPAAASGAAGYDAAHIDAAEALVFWLGGLSKDATRPFTGQGGPVKIVTVGSNQYAVYNQDRESPLFDFEETRLNLGLVDPAAPNTSNLNGQPMSLDERDFHGFAAAAFTNDPFPHYVPEGQEVPYVYFDSRTYDYGTNGEYENIFSLGLTDDILDNGAIDGSYDPNKSFATEAMGVARPMKTDQANADYYNDAAVANFDPRAFYYANRDTFQIICAGLDDHYGHDELLVSSASGFGSAVLWRYPSGLPFHEVALPWTTPSATKDRLIHETRRDNITNFSDGILENGLP
ncbi:MAG: type II secretion system GspH family protein [Pirellulaceae bacterium]|nr:type II secretion system GspH family protein [Pirellulaceae bacterium]MCH2184135.1 type II secretion system GspH family protein [Mariniblastus sp.]